MFLGHMGNWPASPGHGLLVLGLGLASGFEVTFKRMNLHPAETRSVMLVEDLATRASVGKQTDLILLDVSKTFDKVNHSKLI